jgi:hypothetical protein
MAETDVIPVETTQGGRHKPIGILEVIGEIQRYSVAESGGSAIPEDYFTIDMRMEYFWQGMKTMVHGGILMFFLMPLFMGVIEARIPVFGHAVPTLFDRVYVLLLTISFGLSYAVLFVYASRFNAGRVTKAMLNNLFWGATAGSIVKAVTSAVVYHFLYYVVTTEDALYGALRKMSFMSAAFRNDIFDWVLGARPVLLSSSWMIAMTSALYIAICWGSYIVSENRKNDRRKPYGFR